MPPPPRPFLQTKSFILLGYSLHPPFTNKVHKVLFDILTFEEVSNTFGLFLFDAEDDGHGG